ncbi:MAG: hypothetical protein MI742_05795 [Desulfobacterales bacterium]|nr:hypothetical protein [Desulfobacterales bacterium]
MENTKSLTRRVGSFLASIACCLIMIYVVGPWLDSLSAIKPLATFIDERNIDANAYYYTEVEEFADADINMNNTMDHMPR